MQKIRRTIRLIVASTLLVGVVAGGSFGYQPKQYVCHYTGSANNPVVVVWVSGNGWDNGHDKDSHQADRDMRGAEPKGPTFKTGNEACGSDGGGEGEI